jgi:dihydropteroate synthase
MMNLHLESLPSADLRPKPDAFSPVSGRVLNCGSRWLPLSQPHVMAVLNITPDSFSDGGELTSLDPARLRAHAEELVAAGATILDIGGESTRPGAASVSETQECRRVLPVLELLLDLDVVLSVDTSKAGVARRALGLGCHMINDVSGLGDPQMATVLADSQAAVALMHMQGAPRTMQTDPNYIDVVAEIHEFLSEKLQTCRTHGIVNSRICIDPGFGFGKTVTHNLTLLRQLSLFNNLDVAIMVGLSRKSLIGALTGRPVSERLAGSLAAALLAVQSGADIVRVHDVAATVDALKVLTAVASNNLPDS